jgi:hypothetical protein
MDLASVVVCVVLRAVYLCQVEARVLYLCVNIGIGIIAVQLRESTNTTIYFPAAERQRRAGGDKRASGRRPEKKFGLPLI